MDRPDHIEGKVIAITGAAGGFGRLVALATAARGAALVLGDVDAAGLEAVASEITDAGGRALAVETDVTDLAAMRAMVAAGVDAFGSLDVMVNNAGTMPLAFFADHEAAAPAWDRCIDINFKGVVNGISASYDQMISQGRGQVINLSSIYGNTPVSGAGVYGATKAAVNTLSESLRQESQGKIKVTTIRPTGVPGTGLGDGIVNGAAIGGILGKNEAAVMETMGAMMTGEAEPALSDPHDIRYFALDPQLLADQIVYAIDQPWGVSIGDITVRASGDPYMM